MLGTRSMSRRGCLLLGHFANTVENTVPNQSMCENVRITFGTCHLSRLFLSPQFCCAMLQAGKDVKENLKNWAKQQEAELAEEQDSVDRIRKALEEARR